VPGQSKFTAERRQKILEALQVGASRRTAAAVARIDPATLTRWIQSGESAESGSRWRQFFEDVHEAEAHPKMRALGVVYKELSDSPALAWKFIERRESGFAPPMPHASASAPGPVVIQLSFSDGGPLASSQVDQLIEGEAVEQDEAAEPRQLDPASVTPA
jgi:hypothetical protein